MRSGPFRLMVAVAVTAAMLVAGCSAGAGNTPETTPAPTPASSASAAGPGSAASSSSASSGTDAAAPGSSTSGSGAASSSTGPPPGDGSLTVGFVLQPDSLDFTTSDGAAIPQVLLDNVYQTLVTQDPDTGAIVPSLAKSWTVSADNKTYTFQLQPKVTFSDGAAFTADDAAFSINYVKTGWKIALKSAMDVVDSATAVSPTELKVVLKQPSNQWLFKMTTRVGAMFSKTGVANLATTPIGTGPYVFTTWNRGTSIVLTRNEKYWGTPAPLKTVTFRYFQDPTAMNNALLSGGINVISTVQTPAALGVFADKSKYQIIDGTTNGKVMMTMNNAKAPLDNVKVRQAINYALDKNAILQGAWAGYGTVIGSHEVPTDPWYVDLADKYPHDVAKAKQLLAEAGVSNLTLSLQVPPVPYAEAAAPIIVSQLAAVGITVNATPIQFPNWLKTVFAAPYDYQLTIINHVEPRDFTTVFSGKPDYYTQYTNPEVSKLEAEGDAGTQQQMITDYQQVMNILADDAAAVWLWAFPNLMVADVDVHGLPKNAIGEAFDAFRLSVG